MNMKRGKINYSIAFTVLMGLLMINSVSADGCTLTADLVNQDPYPALPGSYVEVLFQLNGIGSNCEDGVSVDLVLEYPFFLDNTESSTRSMKSSTYAGEDYDSFWNTIYKIRIDENALEGDYEVELRYKEGIGSNWDDFSFSKFIINLDDARTDFEIHVDDHNIKTRNLVFEILNTGNQDIEALTVEVPKQENIVVKGSNRNIVGDLDSNEYTTADFEAIPTEGEINLLLYYTDSINERRVLEKTVYYDHSYFVDSMDNIEPNQSGTYVTIGIIVIIVVFLYLKRRKSKKKKKGQFNV
jgi:hypothetical protein